MHAGELCEPRGPVAYLLLALLAVLALRVWGVRRGPPLEPWHTYVPEEPRAEVLDGADWAAYLEAERAAFPAVEANVMARLDPGDRVLHDRYVAASPGTRPICPRTGTARTRYGRVAGW
jgi:hypothetical protein